MQGVAFVGKMRLLPKKLSWSWPHSIY